MKAYKQSTEFTGAASALLMVLNHFKDIELTKEKEFRIWMKTVNLPTRACSIYGLAAYACELGINLRILVGKEEYSYPDYRFKGYKKHEIEAAKFSEQLHLKDLVACNIEVEERDFSLAEVKKFLQDKILMLRLDAGIFRDISPSSSYVVVSNYNGEYKIYDPYQGQISLSEEDMRRSFDDLVTKRKRDHRVIIFG